MVIFLFGSLKCSIAQFMASMLLSTSSAVTSDGGSPMTCSACA